MRTKSALEFENIGIEDTKKYILNESEHLFENYGMITSIDEQRETKSNYQKIKNDSTKIMINLIITYNCNCACKYCFEDLNCTYDSNENKMKEVVSYINDLSEGKDLYINYFGGEPLMNCETIFYIQNNLKGFRNLHSSITTNGTLIDTDKFNKLMNSGIDHFQITIDGTEQTHNFRRPVKGEGSSWKQTINGLKKLTNNNSSPSINVRINIDKYNFLEIKEIFNSLPTEIQNNKNIKFYISPVFGQKNENNQKKELQLRAEVIKETWKKILEEKLPIEIQLPRFSPCTKDNLLGRFYIDLNGRVFSCGADIGKILNVKVILMKEIKFLKTEESGRLKKSVIRAHFFMNVWVDATMKKQRIKYRANINI
ncbi:MAG: radical SAM protein [Tissierellia bacterium]|nr:radical SAM protein [Tissierellia bacterium]